MYVLFAQSLDLHLSPFFTTNTLASQASSQIELASCSTANSSSFHSHISFVIQSLLMIEPMPLLHHPPQPPPCHPAFLPWLSISYDPVFGGRTNSTYYGVEVLVDEYGMTQKLQPMDGLVDNRSLAPWILTKRLWNLEL